MQTVPAAVPEFIRDSKSTIEHVENISLVVNLSKSNAKKDAEEKKSNLKNIKTKALVVKEAKSDFEMQDMILDEIRENEVLVEMKYSGICAFDTGAAIVTTNNLFRPHRHRRPARTSPDDRIPSNPRPRRRRLYSRARLLRHEQVPSNW